MVQEELAVKGSKTQFPAHLSSSRSTLLPFSKASDGDDMLDDSDLDLHQQSKFNTTELNAYRKFRKNQVQERVDRLLQDPFDPMLDMEAELSKVISISPPLVSIHSQEGIFDDEIQAMESKLYDSISHQQFDQAANHARQLSQTQLEDSAAVLQVNARFYNAFSTKDYDEMQSVWLPSSQECVLIHPSHAPILGTSSILSNWKAMFASSASQFQSTVMEPQNIRIKVYGASAIVTCQEHVYSKRTTSGRKSLTTALDDVNDTDEEDEEEPKRTLINQCQATNLFRKCQDDGRWYLVHHHGSLHADSRVAKRVFRSHNGLNTKSKNKKRSKSRQRGRSLIADALESSQSSKDESRKQQEGEPEDEHDLMASILGLVKTGPLIGNDDDSAAKDNKKGTSLSELLGGMFGPPSDDVGDLSDLLGGGADGIGNPGGLGGGPGSGGKAFIRVISTSSSSDDEDDNDEEDIIFSEEEDDNDDEDEGPTIIHLTGGSSRIQGFDDSFKKAIIKPSSNSNGENNKSGGESTPKMSGKAGSNHNNSSREESSALRQSCIQALRKLAQQGALSPKQKRVLQTDIITCSARGEYSLVEVAYDLLIGESDGQDMDATEEEFADQCRVLAANLLDEEDP